MSTYSIVSRLVGKKGFNTLRPHIFISSCFDFHLHIRTLIWTCGNSRSIVFKKYNYHHQDSSSSRFYSTSSSSGSENGDGNDDQSIKKSVQSETEDLGYNPKKDKFSTQDVAHGKKENKGQGNLERPYFEPEKEHEVEEELTPPTNCCGSGCPNCVWIDYVDKLAQKFTGPHLSRDRIMKDLETIDDEGVKAFIKMELRSKGLL